MDPQWDEGSPIYRQLRDRVVAMILEGVLKEGDPLPSVRSVAAGQHKKVIMWGVDTSDWSRPGTGRIVKSVMRGSKAGTIVLMHDGGGPGPRR